MPPKKQTYQRTLEEDEDSDESRMDQECIGSVVTTSVMADPMGEKMDQLKKTLESFMQTQHTRESLLEKEAQRQEHRWRTLQHQFGQLQTEVQKERWERQTLGGVSEQAHPPSTSSHNATLPPRLLHSRQNSEEGEPEIAPHVTSQGVASPEWMGWQGPKMLPLQDDDDTEHYLNI